MLNIKSSRQSGEILDGASLRQILSRIRRKVSRQKQRLHELSAHSTSSSRRRYRSRFSVSIFSRCFFPRDAQTRAIVSKNGRARSRYPPDSSLRTIATVSATIDDLDLEDLHASHRSSNVSPKNRRLRKAASDQQKN